MKPGRALFLLMTVAALAGCANPQEPEAVPSYTCKMKSGSFYVSHPWACLRLGGEVSEASAAPMDWTTANVRVGWQGRESIKSGHVHWNRDGRAGALRLDLPDAGDSCEGVYRLRSPDDADLEAVCASGDRLTGRVFFGEGGVSISGHGKDGHGHTVGFYPLAHGPAATS